MGRCLIANRQSDNCRTDHQQYRNGSRCWGLCMYKFQWTLSETAGAFAINDHQIVDISFLPYLESIIKPVNNLHTEVKKQIGLARGLFSIVWPVVCGGSITFAWDQKLLKSSVLWSLPSSSMPQGHKSIRAYKEAWDCPVQNGSIYARCKTHRSCQNDYRLCDLEKAASLCHPR